MFSRVAAAMLDDEHLADRIYEAAFIPELWPGVLEAASAATGSAAGHIAIYNADRIPRFVASELVRPMLEASAASGLWQHADIVRHMLMAAPLSSFAFDEDVFPPEVLANNVVRLTHTLPLGFAGEVGTFFTLPTGELVTIAFERWQGRNRPSNAEQVAFDTLRPDLARAASVAARLRLSQAQSAVATMASLGLPAAAIDRTGRVLAANAAFERLDTLFLPLAFGRLALGEPSANALLQAALLASGDDGERVRSIPVRAGENRPAAVIQLVPIRRAAHDIFGHGDMMVVASVVGERPLPAGAVLMSLFDLSPAEAKLAQAMASGATLSAFATGAGISIHTARAQLASIFAKTGTHRQAEIVALLAGMPMAGDTG